MANRKLLQNQTTNYQQPRPINGPDRQPKATKQTFQQPIVNNKRNNGKQPKTETKNKRTSNWQLKTNNQRTTADHPKQTIDQ